MYTVLSMLMYFETIHAVICLTDLNVLRLNKRHTTSLGY